MWASSGPRVFRGLRGLSWKARILDASRAVEADSRAFQVSNKKPRSMRGNVDLPRLK